MHAAKQRRGKEKHTGEWAERVTAHIPTALRLVAAYREEHREKEKREVERKAAHALAARSAGSSKAVGMQCWLCGMVHNWRRTLTAHSWSCKPSRKSSCMNEGLTPSCAPSPAAASAAAAQSLLG